MAIRSDKKRCKIQGRSAHTPSRHPDHYSINGSCNVSKSAVNDRVSLDDINDHVLFGMSIDELASMLRNLKTVGTTSRPAQLKAQLVAAHIASRL